MNARATDVQQDSSPVVMPKGALVALLAVCLLAVGAVVFLALRPPVAKPEVILAVTETKKPDDAGLPAINVVDTLADPSAKAVEGGRYRVRISDNAREGSSGIARIGGLVTFVPDTRKGDLAIIEVTRLKRSTADATLIERLTEPAAAAPAPAAVPAAPSAPAPAVTPSSPAQPAGKPASLGLEGQVLRGRVEAMGKEGDGIVKINGKTVFIKGVTLNQFIEFKVTSEKARIAFGELVAVLPPPEAPATAPATPPASPAPPATSTAPVATPAGAKPDVSAIPLPAIGSEHVVTVTEKDRREPEKNGVARMNRLVVFVPGTQPGDRVKIRMVEHMRRAVRAEVVERLPPEPPAPAAAPATPAPDSVPAAPSP